MTHTNSPKILIARHDESVLPARQIISDNKLRDPGLSEDRSVPPKVCFPLPRTGARYGTAVVDPPPPLPPPPPDEHHHQKSYLHGSPHLPTYRLTYYLRASKAFTISHQCVFGYAAGTRASQITCDGCTPAPSKNTLPCIHIHVECRVFFFLEATFAVRSKLIGHA